MNAGKLFQIIFYVPSSHLEPVKNALFAAGAGVIGNYSHCCWQVKGEGQFMPLPGNNAYTGSTHELERIEEYKVELVCNEAYLAKALEALKKEHPYETPAYFIIDCVIPS